jgi:Leucine-rich repeat (LRR) protein
LNLSNNQIVKIPEAVGDMENLAVLDLSDNQITQLPTTLDNLKKLKHFDLVGNSVNAKSISSKMHERWKKFELNIYIGEKISFD